MTRRAASRLLTRAAVYPALFLLLSLVTACDESTADESSRPDDESKATFTTADCQFSSFYDEAECGFLKVPLDRSGKSGRSASIHVAIYRSWGFDPAPDPVVFIDGGPGSNTLDSIDYAFSVLAESRFSRSVMSSSSTNAAPDTRLLHWTAPTLIISITCLPRTIPMARGHGGGTQRRSRTAAMTCGDA